MRGQQIRDQLACTALVQLLRWFGRGGQVGIFDATNSTRQRRCFLRDVLVARDIRPLFVEVICDDIDVIRTRVRQTKVFCPEYRGVVPEVAEHDFMERIRAYARLYEPVWDDSLVYCKLVNSGQQVILNRVQGNLAWDVATFVGKFNPTPSPIWLTRHGQSEGNLAGQIGGDSPLTPLGQVYAARLAQFMRELLGITQAPPAASPSDSAERGRSTRNGAGPVKAGALPGAGPLRSTASARRMLRTAPFQAYELPAGLSQPSPARFERLPNPFRH